MSSYRTSPADTDGMPSGVPNIIANEAAERFSFYGMKAVLAVFMASYLHLMDGGHGPSMGETRAAEYGHYFNTAVYALCLLGALFSDVWLGKYRTIISLSLVYCLGHAALACMGYFGNSGWWLFAGLGLIALGSGGIKPCVSAHVGDQFGARNAALLPRVFNWFYFSINLGAMVSMMLTPWLLEWHGPHWAFGVPGVLMALATLVFWLGRHRFVHVPAVGLRAFLGSVFGGGGLAVLRLVPLYLFIAMFWALFDQTGTTWVFQAQQMDLRFAGIDWLPSQVQSLNSVFVLLFIPLFAYGVYPLVERVYRLTPLRKIGIGLLVMTASYVLVTQVQSWIDSGQRPSIGWQILAYALLTASEVMVSIPALEFAYTQAPKSVKSLVMCLYLLAVAVGNFFDAQVNQFIQIPDTAAAQLEVALLNLPPDWRNSPRTVVLPGMDGITGNQDDLVQRVHKGKATKLEVPGLAAMETAAKEVERMSESGFPREEEAGKLVAKHLDAWGRPLRYELLHSNRARIVSSGPDGKTNTRWDVGLVLERSEPPKANGPTWSDAFRPAKPWLARFSGEAVATSSGRVTFSHSAFCGGQTKLHGAAYFRFFMWLMLGTALLYVPYAMLYRGAD